MRAVVVIPARYKSSRFPGKPLIDLLGRPMILRVADLCADAVGLDSVYIATDDIRIKNVVAAAGYQVVMTSGSALTGTDRVAEVAKKVEADIYVNVQGDEPLLNPKDILSAIKLKSEFPADVVNACCKIECYEDAESVNIPKVVFNESKKLVYMSRKAVPGTKIEGKIVVYYKQVCIYAFSKHELDQFSGYGVKSTLEDQEDIEILRFLELDVPVRMLEVEKGSMAIDVPEDVGRVVAALEERSS